MEMEVEHLGFILQVTRAMTVLPESLDFSTVAIAPDMVVWPNTKGNGHWFREHLTQLLISPRLHCLNLP